MSTPPIVIKTRKIGATDTHGDKVRATNGVQSVSISWDYSLGTEDMHKKAAQMMAGSDVILKRSKVTNTGYEFVIALRKLKGKANDQPV